MKDWVWRKTNHFDGIAWENRAKSPIFFDLAAKLGNRWRDFGANLAEGVKIFAIRQKLICIYILG